MIKKRLVGLVTVKNGKAVQSIGYKRYLPLGRPECLVENLDRWGADEIFLQVIDRSAGGQGPDFDLLGRISRLGLSTPLIYGGGIRTLEDGIEVIQNGADRLVVDALLLDNPDIVRKLSQVLGAQALIGGAPFLINQDNLFYVNYRDKAVMELPLPVLSLMRDFVISELLLIDCVNEGLDNGFDQRLLEKFPIETLPLILFGGISSVSLMKNLLNRKNVSAIAVGNFLNYREHALQKYKEELGTTLLRQPNYRSSNSLL